MQQTRVRLCAMVGFAVSIACSSSDGGPPSAGAGSSSIGGQGASGGLAAAGHASAGGNLNSGGASSAGSTSATGNGNGGVPAAGTANGGASAGNASGGVGGAGTGGASAGGASAGGQGGSGGRASGGASGMGGSGGTSSGGASAGSGGKGSAGSNAGAAGAGGKGSGGASGSGGSSACAEGVSQLCGMTAQHNQARANVNPVPATPLPTMSWDTTVAAAAQTWADQCNFSHNTAGYGQNLYASAGGGAPSPSAVVTDWVSEASAYNYSANTCSGTCGHYTQVVWRNSTSLGCGFKACSTNSPFGAQYPNWYIVVCDYSPAGNNGSRPY